MRILLTGVNGQLGYELAPRLGTLGTLTATDRATLDLEMRLPSAASCAMCGLS